MKQITPRNGLAVEGRFPLGVANRVPNQNPYVKANRFAIADEMIE